MNERQIRQAGGQWNRDCHRQKRRGDDPRYSRGGARAGNSLKEIGNEGCIE
jgi:hypothetical protein